ncbi:transcriptional antiterminator [Paraburkholderia sp. USG1]|uniref:transcriptional antiterminator n=1 Tax=Paraburkholderia sp. USG1 TaxID=2952268 RepID=UPI002858DF97|nr:transcriptional antiterminator [Paraburkholderia sp. USG1]MDR8401860.1 transcriptional antiterminator [Paraburkholderia sp. USG1]
MQALLKNDIFDGSDGCHYRVIRTSSSNAGWVMNLSHSHAWPVQREFAALRSHAQAPKPESSHNKLPAFAFFSETARKRANEAYEAIRPLLVNEDGTENTDIFDEAKRNQLVRARANELGMSKTTLYVYLHKWWSLGQSKFALIPGSARNGRGQNPETAGRGRTPNDCRYRVYQMEADDIKWAKDIIQKQFIKKEHASLKGVHADLISKHYSFKDGNGKNVKRPEGEHPSIHQMRNVLRKYFTLEDVKRGKHGDKDFDREHKPMDGSSLEEAVAPGHIYEIDATILDVFLVAIANRECIIGKPTLYLIYDRKTRLCVGFSLTLENASWTGAMLAILSIAVDKRALCEKYGQPYHPAQWPADGVFPSKFLGDRGEMASRNSDRICDGMEAIISNTQALLPIRKGLVESGFKVIHTAIKDQAPGYEPPREAKKRRAKKYHLDAVLTLEECTSLVLGTIIKHNTTVMRRYPLSPEQVLAGWDAIPNQLWQNEVERNGCAGARYTYDYLHMQLLPRADNKEKPTVTQDGILFKNCTYTYEDGDETVRQWIIRAGLKGSFSVDCSYDPRLVDNIILHGSDDKTHKCKLAKDSVDFAGYSFAEVQYVVTRAKRDKQAQGDAAMQAEMERRARNKATVDAAKAATKKDQTGAARSARRADTAAARNAEKTWRRRESVAMPSTTNGARSGGNVIHLPSSDQVRDNIQQPTVPPVDTGTTRPRSPIDDLLRRKAQEKTNELPHL